MIYDETTVSKLKSDNKDIHNFLYARYKWFLFHF